jgi:hypothetical protein
MPVAMVPPVAKGIVEGGEGAPAVEKAVPVAIGVKVIPDDLTCVVDAVGKGGSSRGKIEVGESTSPL